MLFANRRVFNQQIVGQLNRAKSIQQVIDLVHNAEDPTSSIPLALRMVGRLISRENQQAPPKSVVSSMFDQIDFESLDTRQLSYVFFWARCQSDIRTNPLSRDQKDRLYDAADDMINEFTYTDLAFLFFDQAKIGRVGPSIHERLCEFLDDESFVGARELTQILKVFNIKNNYYPTRAVLNSAINAVRWIEDPAQLEEVELIEIFDALVKLYDTYPKLKIQTQMKRFRKAIEEDVGGFSHIAVTRLLDLQLKFPEALNDLTIVNLLEKQWNDLLDENHPPNPKTFLFGTGLITQYHNEGIREIQEGHREQIQEGILRNFTRTLGPRYLKAALHHCFFLGIQDLHPELQMRFQDSLKLLQRGNWVHNLQIYTYCTFYGIDTSEMRLDPKEMTRLHFEKRLDILKEIDLLPQDTKSETIEMMIKQSLIQDIEAIADFRQSLYVGKKLGEAHPFSRQSPKTREMRRIITQKLDEFSVDAKTKAVWLPLAISLSSGIEESWPCGVSQFSHVDINKSVERFKGDFSNLLWFLDLAKGKLSAENVLCAAKFVKGFSDPMIPRYCELLEVIADDEHFEPASFSDSLYKINLIVERNIDLLPKFSDRLVKILDENWYHEPLKISIASAVVDKLTEEKAKQILDRQIELDGGLDSRGIKLMRKFPKLKSHFETVEAKTSTAELE